MMYRMHSENKHGVYRVWEAEHNSDEEALRDAHDHFSYTEDWWVQEIDRKGNVLRHILRT